MVSLNPKPYTLYPLAILLGLLLSINSCAPSLDDPGVPNALLASPDTVSLNGLTDTKNISLRQRCGCPFTLDSAYAVSGDTDRIVMSFVELQMDTVSTHNVSFAAKPGTATGSYSAAYMFKVYSYSARAFLPAPVTVKLVVP
jgi:hypothetical protein